MEKHITSLFIAIFIGTAPVLLAQQKPIQDSIRTANILFQKDKNKVQFTAETPPLRQIAGAPQAFYTYYWEFGDGHYSMEESPSHTYRKPGDYTVRLSTTNNYDDGIPPGSRPTKLSVSATGYEDFDDENLQLLDTHYGFRLRTNREPVPGEEIQMVVSYASDKDYPTSGKLYLFYNEKKYKANNFDLTDLRTHYGEYESLPDEPMALNAQLSLEKILLSTGLDAHWLPENDTIYKKNLPASLQDAHAYYRDYKSLSYDDMQPGEKRNAFVTLKATPEMLKDTSAIITVKSIWVPERGTDAHQVRTHEMEIVTSHDPNKMALSDSRLNYRLVRFKRLQYKVRFQNNGEGPARLIKLNVDLPKMLDKTSLKILDMYPKVPICPDGEDVRYSCIDTVFYEDKVSFQFKNIYLPGSNQKGVQERDSTKGFVKYSMKFGKDFHKVTSKSKTAIIFDKNEPIITNTARARFTIGISPGVRAGYHFWIPKNDTFDESFTNAAGELVEIPDVTEKIKGSSYSFGVTYSPYKSYKWYYQAELYAEMQNQQKEKSMLFASDRQGVAVWEGRDYLTVLKQTNMDIVPASIRYNFNKFFAAGAGVQLNWRMGGTSQEKLENRFYEYIPNQAPTYEITDWYIENETSSDLGFQLDDVMPFVDITAGLARIGPSVGVRYLYPLKREQDMVQVYAIWKF